MTKFQKNVLAYLGERGSLFINWLAAQPGVKTLVIIDICPLVLKFLEEQLRSEMSAYTRGYRRYHELTDMLIELHLEISGDFKECLNGTASQFLANKSKTPN